MKLKRKDDEDKDYKDKLSKIEDDLAPYDVDEENFDDLDDFGDFDNFSMGSDGYGIPAMEKHKDLLRDLTNFEPFIKEKINNWLGVVWDEENRKWKRSETIQPIISIKGASWASGYLQTYARNNNIITDIGLDAYKDMIEEVQEAIILNIGCRDEFEIRENGDFLRIINELIHSTQLVLMGAGDGRYKKLLQEVVTRNENVNLDPGIAARQNPKAQSVFERFKKVIGGV